jgi:hypothetical protein
MRQSVCAALELSKDIPVTAPLLVISVDICQRVGDDEADVVVEDDDDRAGVEGVEHPPPHPK